ncbi:kinase-like domain-containing protein [Penicillium sp. IBT 16267x]|nr:kinase-like domain-containing protein [Penicillium sp. IBT 16267x]KAJ6090559.1 kinase-like domain-containing protein [Penicillium sp. IBT 16267x]
MTKRSLSLQMNDMSLTTPAELKLASTIFCTASSHMKALAGLHMHDLIHQNNDFPSTVDFPRGVTARKLFQRLAQEKKFTDVTLEDARHTLCCDSFHPAHVLLKEEQKVAVLGWNMHILLPWNFLTHHFGGFFLRGQSSGQQACKTGRQTLVVV